MSQGRAAPDEKSSDMPLCSTSLHLGICPSGQIHHCLKAHQVDMCSLPRPRKPKQKASPSADLGVCPFLGTLIGVIQQAIQETTCFEGSPPHSLFERIVVLAAKIVCSQKIKIRNWLPISICVKIGGPLKIHCRFLLPVTPT